MALKKTKPPCINEEKCNITGQCPDKSYCGWHQPNGDAPKTPITQVRALYPMRKHHHKEYNIFPLTDGQYEGRVFDRNRRIDYKTPPISTPDKAILACRSIAELLAKGQCVPEGMAIHVDEGKAIREKEDKKYQDFKKAQRKKKGGK
jgi:hypothetical protein